MGAPAAPRPGHRAGAAPRRPDDPRQARLRVERCADGGIYSVDSGSVRSESQARRLASAVELEGEAVEERNVQPQEFSTGYGNRMTVAVNLATGQARVLSDAETAREAAEATRRAAD